MRHTNQALFGLLAVLLASTAACNGAAPTTTSTGDENPKDVRMSLTGQGKSDATVEVTAIDQITNQAALKQSILVKGGATTVVELSIPPSGYTFQVEAFADAAETISLGTSSTGAKVEADQTTEIALFIATDAKGGASVHVTADQAPKIDDLAIELGGGAGVAAQIHVEASDADGAELHFFWSGFGIDGVVEGSSTLTISLDAAASATGKAEVHVVVQDALGATAAAAIDVSAIASAGAQAGTSGGGSADVDVKACLQLHAGCTASCNAAAAASLAGATALVSCLAQCSVSLATCESKK